MTSERLADFSRRHFSHASFARMLDAFLDAGYAFRGFHAPGTVDAETPKILMRHDIDMELDAALDIARLEAAKGTQSTFFFMLRTEHYNLFSTGSSDMVNEILDLGHHLGLHFDCAAYDNLTQESAIAEACAREVDVLRHWFGRAVVAVSFHRPNALVLQGSPALSGSLPHTYESRFTTQFKYVSDSNGTWREGLPSALPEFAARRDLHILIHPIWWSPRPVLPFETLERLVARRQAVLRRSLAANCRSYRVGDLAHVGS